MNETPESTDFIDLIVSATDFLLRDRLDDATSLLSRENEIRIVQSSRKSISLIQQIHVFRRDHYTCRYCGQRTLFVPVMRVLSTLIPDLLPYHLHWKMSECHIAYWRYAASIDHIIPVARGGDASSKENLVTSCYMCNSIKQNWLIDELRWQIQPIGITDWNGLSSRLPSLCEIANLAHEPYFEKWLRALAQVEHPQKCQ